jgi:hypothetical protein
MGKKRAAGAAAVLLTTGLLGVAAPQSAQAGQPTEHSVGTLWDTSVGIPKVAKRGQTIEFHTWFIQHSHDTVLEDSDQVVVWNPALSRRTQDWGWGATVTWLDPVTHKWVPSSLALNGNAQQWLILPTTPQVRIPPGRWEYIDIKITFSKTARTGTWLIDPMPVNGYNLLTASGRPDNWGFLTVRQAKPYYKLTLR